MGSSTGRTKNVADCYDLRLHKAINNIVNSCPERRLLKAGGEIEASGTVLFQRDWEKLHQSQPQQTMIADSLMLGAAAPRRVCHEAVKELKGLFSILFTNPCDRQTGAVCNTLFLE